MAPFSMIKLLYIGNTLKNVFGRAGGDRQTTFGQLDCTDVPRNRPTVQPWIKAKPDEHRRLSFLLRCVRWPSAITDASFTVAKLLHLLSLPGTVVPLHFKRAALFASMMAIMLSGPSDLLKAACATSIVVAGAACYCWCYCCL